MVPVASVAMPTSDCLRALLARLAADFDADDDLPRGILRGYGRSSADAERYARAVAGPAPVSGGDAGLPSADDVWLVVGTGATRRNRFRLPSGHGSGIAAGLDVEADAAPSLPQPDGPPDLWSCLMPLASLGAWRCVRLYACRS